jgi:hypothetical protein
MKKLTQADLILRHMRHGNGITPREALRLYGCLRLAARIYDLKVAGWRIKDRVIIEDGKHWKEYFL